MSANHLPLQFPLWQYLCQPVGRRDRKLVVHPMKFWHIQKVHFIERCWIMAYSPEERAY
jgi:hypothetical protein